MKKEFTQWKYYRGLLLFSLLVTLQLSLSAQTSHAVTVTNGTFTPDTLTINVGDTVVWTNMEGNHNVNGTTATFPSNMESFGNEVGPPGWVFSHVFTKAGVYDYHCDPHAQFGMVGKVIVMERTSHAVNTTTGLEPINEITEVLIYPNPVIDQFFVSSEKNIQSISIYNTTGAKILEYGNINRAELEISLVGIRTGLYLVDVQFDDNTSKVSRLVKR